MVCAADVRLVQAQKIREERQKVLKQFEKLQKGEDECTRFVLLACSDGACAEVDTKEKIEKSNAINQARLRLLRERETVMAEALQSAVAQLPKLGDVKDPAYRQRLESLVLQGLIKLEVRACPAWYRFSAEIDALICAGERRGHQCAQERRGTGGELLRCSEWSQR